jgi:phosphoribosylpyrophosphate synthetase
VLLLRENNVNKSVINHSFTVHTILVNSTRSFLPLDCMIDCMIPTEAKVVITIMPQFQYNQQPILLRRRFDSGVN